MESKLIHPAATVMLIRDRNQCLEVLMAKRSTKSPFGDIYVFPGGKIDASDHNHDLYERCKGLSDIEASALLGLEEDGLAYWVAVARECFEEVGIILGKGIFSNGRLSDDRVLLNKGKLSYNDLLKKYNATIETENIAYCAHWITPIIEPKRFSTRFFITIAPNKIEGWHDGFELTDSLWIKPADALQKHRAGKFNIIMPTIKNLEVLNSFSSSEDAMAHFQNLPAGSIQTILPKFYKENNKWVGLLPGDEGYDER